jgi:hypothetical protein
VEATAATHLTNPTAIPERVIQGRVEGVRNESKRVDEVALAGSILAEPVLTSLLDEESSSVQACYMTADAARGIARAVGSAGRFAIEEHALQRMQQRGAQRNDVGSALANALSCVHDPPPDNKWKVTGPDLDGDPLTVVIALLSSSPGLPAGTVWTAY